MPPRSGGRAARANRKGAATCNFFFVPFVSSWLRQRTSLRESVPTVPSLIVANR